VALADGSIWEREALWQEVERVLRNERNQRRKRNGPGRPKGSGPSGPGALSGISLAQVQKVWRALEMDRKAKQNKVPVSRAAVARKLEPAVSVVTFWRWRKKNHIAWPPL